MAMTLKGGKKHKRKVGRKSRKAARKSRGHKSRGRK